MNSRRGFTVPELMVSSVILVILALAGLVSARSAVMTTRDSVMLQESEARTSRALRRTLVELRSAGRSTLQAVPPGSEALEDMQEGVAYDNLRFRQARTVFMGEPLYVPAPGEAPLALWLERDPEGVIPPRVLWFDGERNQVMGSGFEGLRLERQGRRLTVTLIRRMGPDGAPEETLTRSLLLRVP